MEKEQEEGFNLISEEEGKHRKQFSVGKGKHRVWFTKHEELNGDLVYVLGGGESPHIGGVVLQVPGEEARILNVTGHYDHHVLIPMAEEASKKYRTRVVVIGGVHVDNATKEDIDILVKNCRSLYNLL